MSLAIFLSVFYTNAWLTCTSASNAPSNDLELIKKLLKVEVSITKNSKPWSTKFLSLVSSARQKLENHLDYLSERLVIFAIFSDIVSPSDKSQMKEKLRIHLGPVTNSLQEKPHPMN